MMNTNLLEYLENSALRLPEKVAFWDEQEEITYQRLLERSRRIGTGILKQKPENKVIALLLHPRSIRYIEAIFGSLYAGCAYAPLDTGMPSVTLATILNMLEPGLILTDEMGGKAMEGLKNLLVSERDPGEETWNKIPVMGLYSLAEATPDEALLSRVRKKSSVFDPVSILYTSGTTGIPKGSVQNHFSYLHWTEATIEMYGFTEEERLANQSPFFYANSIIDLYPPVALGASVYLLSPGVLTFPGKMIECLNRHKITELTMTPSSFIGITKAGLPEKGSLPYLRYGIMSGETMPWEPLQTWMEASPGAEWWHFYGSTEMFSVAVGRVSGKPEAGKQLSVGKPFPLVHILFVDEDGAEVPEGTPGEMLLSSPWIALGYHRDMARTEMSWCMDPLKKGWQERFYRSGDLGYLKENGELVVLGRKDAQIKHNGYRMELGEVETALCSLEACEEGCVLFQKESGKIWCFYTGAVSEKELKRALKKKLAPYMLPDRYMQLEEMPHTASMKLNRGALKVYMKE